MPSFREKNTLVLSVLCCVIVEEERVIPLFFFLFVINYKLFFTLVNRIYFNIFCV